MNVFSDLLTSISIRRDTACQCRQGSNGEEYARIDCTVLTDVIAELKNLPHIRLIALWAAQDFEQYRGFTLFYCFEILHDPALLVLEVQLHEQPVISIASDFPIACYFEREVRDGFGIEFEGAFDTRRLFLHEAYPDDFHPLLKSLNNRQPDIGPEDRSGVNYIFKPVEGEGVYQVPVGPVHAGIIEPGHFRFGVMGETIFNLEIRLFYKHRGLEKLAEGMKIMQGTAVAESISGDESACNAAAYAMAIECITGCDVPERAWQLRTVLLEMERIYSHLGDLAGMQVDVAFPVGASPLFILREEVLRYNALLTGSRFLKKAIIPGGLKSDISPGILQGLKKWLAEFKRCFNEAVKITNSSSWVIDRFDTTGIVQNRLVAALNLTGPIARSSGVGTDTRMDHPYGIYKDLNIRIPVKNEGDVLARFSLKAEEVIISAGIIENITAELKPGPIYNQVTSQDGCALVLIEAPRGQNLHWLDVKNGVIDRYKVRTASFCNWLAIEHAVPGNIVPDFPLINKSMNLSYAGNDL